MSTSEINPNGSDPDLTKLRESLLRKLRVNLGPGQDNDAFERHQLLAIRFHRAARLNLPNAPSETTGWVQYLEEHFPKGKEHAERLWIYWRISLLKNECPGSRVVISHGQPHFHWQIVDPGARLYINLESMWDDFERSVDHFLRMLSTNPERQEAALAWWAKHQYSVQTVRLVHPLPTSIESVASASASASASSLSR